MRIINIMFSKRMGGIEQVFLDYHDSLQNCGVEMISICHPKFPKARDEFIKIRNYGWWDIIASLKIKFLVCKYKPDAIIVHGSRAVRITRRFVNNRVIGVAHNYWVKHLLRCNYIFAITEHLKEFLVGKGFPAIKIIHIPNMIDTSGYKYFKHSMHKPLQIRAMGRFVQKKGFEVLIKAASILKERGLEFKLEIGGHGELHKNYEDLVRSLNLEDKIRFIGWVIDKQKFYEGADIFVLPSHSEPFGIVVLEAFLHSVPIVSTQSEGPSEIIEDGKTGIIVPLNNPEAMAEAIINLSENQQKAEEIAKQAFDKVVGTYSSHIIAGKIRDFIWSTKGNE